VNRPLIVVDVSDSELRTSLVRALEAGGFPVKDRGRDAGPAGGDGDSSGERLLLTPWVSGRTDASTSAASAGSEAGVASDLDRLFAADSAANGGRRPNLLKRALEGPERAVLARALESTGGNREKAARLLGLHRATLFAKLRKHGFTNGPRRPRIGPS
jgi:DNA-binding protein Fis